MLRTQKLGEADRIVTLLTREHGRVRAVAKGVRRTRSKFGSRLEPFTHVDVQLYAGRILDVVTQAETLTAFGAGARRRLRPLHRRHRDARDGRAAHRRGARAGRPAVPAAGRWPARADRRRARPGPGARRVPAALARGRRATPRRSTRAPAAGRQGPHRAFTVQGGGSVCPDCRTPGSASPDPATLALLAALLSGDWAIAEAASRRNRREGTGLVAAYLQWHLERGLRSLPLVERRLGGLIGWPRRARRPTARPAPQRRPTARSCRPTWSRGTSPSSWTATAAGPTSAACPGPRATPPARRRCSTSSRARSRPA